MKKNTERFRQKMLSQIDIKKRGRSLSEREELYKKKYLSEIILEEKPIFKSNNLILAPVGSGKSHLIENVLIPKDFNKKILYLTSNSALKDSVCPNNNVSREILAKSGEGECFFTSANKSKFGNKPYSVHVMTYAEFGERISPANQEFTEDIELVFCDEIHSLATYFSYDKSYKLGIALNWLLRPHEKVQIFYFTATRENIDKMEKNTPGYFNKLAIFDYLEHPEIRKYVTNSTYFINHINQLKPHLSSKLTSFNYYGYKALAFTKLIKEQEKIAEIAIEVGFKPIILWSINNENKMNDEQLQVREFILNTGNIPEPYNLLIINGAMQEGWNLYDDKVTLAILDTTDITEQIQALGRIRKDIDLVIKKTHEKNDSGIILEVPSYYLNVDLTFADKTLLCEELYVLDEQGRLKMWPTIKKLLKDSGYSVKDEYKMIDGRKTRTSVISITEDEPTQST